MAITKDEFDSYERVRVGGRTNMFMISNVEILSGLSVAKIKEIMADYGNLKQKFALEKEGVKDEN